MEHLHDDYLAASQRHSTAIEQAEYNLVAMLKPLIIQDGNQWCVLLGENLQVGIAGFGDSPYLAILDFNRQFTKKI